MISVLLFASLSISRFQGEPRPSDEAPSVRVMSFNMRYGTAQDGEDSWPKRRDFLVDTIRYVDPDLLGTQETLADQRDFLAAKLTDHEAWGVGRDDGAREGEMAALFYRKSRFEMVEGGNFWLSPTPETVGSKGWDAALPRIASWVVLKDRRSPDSGEILFLNTHFDHRGRTARREAASLIRSKLGELGRGRRLVVTGDFNAGESDPPHAALFSDLDGRRSPVVDVYRVAHPDRSPDEGTFNGFKPNSVRGARIDWIGASRDWEVVDAAIDRTVREGRTPSDHFAVTATLRPRVEPSRP
ncbi:MAG: endonuclease/exonuclease/phosphatase family protein [Isosphaeraceae bacterium]|nr:endonuclease/exonuclease/phosphatase family protein [Isosphaeraceae bacterium]